MDRVYRLNSTHESWFCQMTTLRSLLCADNWWWDSGEESFIRFHEDGTGEVSLRFLHVAFFFFFTGLS